MDLKSQKFGFIGGGNMARAIGAGLIKKGVLDPKNVWVSARTENTLKYWKELGTSTSVDNLDIISHCDVIFLAVKPQMLNDAMSLPHRPELFGKKLFVSVLVGVTIATLQTMIYDKLLLRDEFAVIRTMPSTPLMVGEGITVYCTRDNVTLPNEDSLVREIFSHLGIVDKVAESQMNAIGALSGSGPAFAYQIIEALSDGAVMAGVPRAMATKFASQVLIGAGKMVMETGKHPGQLKDEVCSPGGTTITGIHAMEAGGVRVSLMNAIKAAVARSEELSMQMKKK